MWTNLATKRLLTHSLPESSQTKLSSHHFTKRSPGSPTHLYVGSPEGVYTGGSLLERVSESPGNSCCWFHDRDLKVKVKSLSHVRLFATPWTAAHQAPPSMGFSRQECWSGCHCLLRRKQEETLMCRSAKEPFREGSKGLAMRMS